MKKEYVKPKVYKDSRHIRWNHEKSPENFDMENPLVRYHFVIVDNKDRDGILTPIISQLDKVTSGLIEIRRKEGKVSGSKFRYLFTTYDSPVSPRMIDWTKVKKSLKRDLELRERKIGSIEDYVVNLYER